MQFNIFNESQISVFLYFPTSFRFDPVKDSFKAKGLDAVKEKLMVDQMSETDRNAYNRHWENKRYEASMFDTAMFEGEQKGKIVGIKEGIKEGEIKRNIEIAQNLIRIGMTVENISSATGLTIDEINELKK